MMIILTAEQAEHVRGPCGEYSELDPRPLADGAFALPARVLDDPDLEEHRDYLAALPRRAVSEEEWLMSAPDLSGS